MPSSDTALSVTTVQPFNGASRDTIARWKRHWIYEAGINNSIFHLSVAYPLPQAVPMPVVSALKLNWWNDQQTLLLINFI